MAEAAGRPAERRRRTALYVGIFAVAASTLAFEILLTRVVSVIAWYHLAFFVVSLAMLGMTAGALAVYLRPRAGLDPAAAMQRDTTWFAASVPLSLACVLAIPLQPVGSLVDFAGLLLSGTCLALPFFAAGRVLALALTGCDLVPRTAYAVDMIGAASGCVAVIPLLDAVDAPSAGLVAAAGAALGAAAFARAARGSPRFPLGLAIVLLGLAGFNATASPAWLRPTWVKGEREHADDFDHVGWNTFSRVTVTRSEERAPDMWSAGFRAGTATETPVRQRVLRIDGAAATIMLDARAPETEREHLDWDVSSFAWAMRPHGAAAVVGVGGGRDVIQALRTGHAPVVGIELNDLVVELHRGVLREESGLADDPAVELVADEARSFLARERRRFSVIVMSLIDTWASTGSGAYALSENGLYTVEAWRTFLDRLEPDGVLAVSRWWSPDSPGETARMLALAIESLHALGVTEPRRHMIAAHAGRVVTLLVSPSALSADDLARARAEARLRGFSVVLAPDKAPIHPLLADLWRAPSRAALWQIASAADLDLTPPTDDRPFFFNMLGAGALLRHGLELEALDQSFLGNLQATATLAAAIVVALVLTLATIAVPLWHRRRSLAGVPPGPALAAGAYFAAIGLGFMFVEIGLLSRLGVFLGHPVLALAVVLAGLIAATGVGSGLSGRFDVSRRRVAVWFPLVPAAVVALSIPATAVLVDGFADTGTPTRIGIAAACVALPGLGLGLGFPLGLELVMRSPAFSSLVAADSERRGGPLGAWLWGINGAFGVCASGLALATSMAFGVTSALAVGVVCYLALPLCTRALAPSAPTPPSSP